jgi:hypothetical protein
VVTSVGFAGPTQPYAAGARTLSSRTAAEAPGGTEIVAHCAGSVVVQRMARCFSEYADSVTRNRRIPLSEGHLHDITTAAARHRAALP